MDPTFNHISKDPDFWGQVINNYYKKYAELAQWHKDLVHYVERNHKWTSPTGRTYAFQLTTNHRGERVWPRTKILNYPVQGLGADLMSLARVSMWNRLRDRPNILFCNTVHDSILLDVAKVDESLISEIHRAFNNVPRNFDKVFGSKFNLPMKCKIKCGKSWDDMKEI